MSEISHLLRRWFGKAKLSKQAENGQFTAQGTIAAGHISSLAGFLAPSIGSFTTAGTPPAPELTLRIKRAYRLAIQTFHGPGTSMWNNIGERNARIHQALLADDDSFETILRNPGQSDLFYGFHSLFVSRTGQLREASDEERRSMIDALAQEFLRLCQAVGLRPIRNPEAKYTKKGNVPGTMEDLETVLRDLDAVFGIHINFPNPYPDEFGIVTSRGIASYRAVHALYQAFRLRQLANVYGPRVLEIGAGMGRTIGYAYELGFRQCTIVDLPMTNVAQASFLGQTLGPESITLFGEEPRQGAIRILPPEWLHTSGEDFDVVLNVDSMTEMDRRYADEYAAFIKSNGKCFLSINHDANSFRVWDLSLSKSSFAQRFPYWMREGYTEELYIQSDVVRKSP